MKKLIKKYWKIMVVIVILGIFSDWHICDIRVTIFGGKI